jgi:hypothetical protein
MSTDTINQAVQATNAIDDILTEARLDLCARSYNAHGAFIHPALVKDNIERAMRRLAEAVKGIEETHWPSEAEYRKV